MIRICLMSPFILVKIFLKIWYQLCKRRAVLKQRHSNYEVNALQYCSLTRDYVPLWNCSPFTEPRFWPNWGCLALTSKHISKTRSNILISDRCSCTETQWRFIRLLKGSQWIWIIVWLSFIILVVSDTHSVCVVIVLSFHPAPFFVQEGERKTKTEGSFWAIRHLFLH